MNYESIRLDKSMYVSEGGFSAALEKLDPTVKYNGTDCAGLDAFQRQLKRYDIKVGGTRSDVIAKFFATSDSAALFPEYVSRAVAQGAKEAGMLDDIIASKTEINSMDYRSIRTDLTGAEMADEIGEGEEIPQTTIALSEHLVNLKKRGRLLCASYEAIKFQRVDVFTVALRQIGAYIAKAQLRDAVEALINGGGGVPAAQVINTAASALAYTDLLRLWNSFESFDMNVILASPDMAMDVLNLDEFKDPRAGCGFEGTGKHSAPMGAKLIKSSTVPAGSLIALDKRFALEMVCAGGVNVEYDKLINTQLERASVTSIYGFSKIFPDAVKVLTRG
ncbi:MAG: phage major capsid protein [Oscillospiraceae bacterium]|nr:phage major capsid protein [Oscillospiraceae bacterium]